ncbi:MAG TPA: hypothetical protein VNM90_29020, partial [Haliangium sp.]|nr:hypothetical protein [Haliangium sp.]
MNCIHFIWLGGQLPQKALENLARWLDAINPKQWKVVLWTNRACLELARARQESRLWRHSSFHGPEKDNALVLSAAFGATPLVYFIHDGPGSESCHIVCFEDVFRQKEDEKLVEACLYEIDYGLKPVASDILRIMILCRFGGWYVDIGDAGLSEKPFPDHAMVDQALAPKGFLCHVVD